MTFVFLDPILIRLYSALVLVTMSSHVSLESIGTYALAIVCLTAIQGVFDTSLRFFFLNKSSSNLDTIGMKLSSRTEIIFQNLLVLSLVAFLIIFKQAPIYFWLLILCPFAWSVSRRLHINEMRSELFHLYSRNRVIVTFFVYLVCVLLVLLTQSVIPLIILQVCLEPAIGITHQMSKKSDTPIQLHHSITGQEWKREFRKFQGITFSNWVITLWDRFSLGLFLTPSKFAIWSLLQVLLKGPIESLGIAFNSLLRKTYHARDGRVSSLSSISMMICLLSAHVLYFSVNTILFGYLEAYFPMVAERQPILGLVLLSALAQVINFISLNHDVYHSRYKTSTQWLTIVMLSSPLIVVLCLYSWSFGLVSIILRDAGFMFFNKSTGTNRIVRASIASLILVEMIILATIAI